MRKLQPTSKVNTFSTFIATTPFFAAYFAPYSPVDSREIVNAYAAKITFPAKHLGHTGS
jgi:hypothetical protein